MNRRVSIVMVGVSIVATLAAQAAAQSWEEMLEEAVRTSDIAFVGSVVEVDSIRHEGGETFAEIRVEVEHHLYGDVAEGPMDASLRFLRGVRDLENEKSVVWILRKSDGAHDFDVLYWRITRWWQVFWMKSRSDRKTKIHGMSPPKDAAGPITLALGIPDGKGGVVQEGELPPPTVPLRMQFENISDDLHTVLPPLDGSTAKWRYPYVWWEVIDEAGEAYQPRGVGRCGNVDPWRVDNFIELRPGEVMRAFAPSMHFPPLPPGRYKARVWYEMRRSLELRGQLGANEVGVSEAMQGAWEGRLHSNWIEFTVEPDDEPSGTEPAHE